MHSKPSVYRVPWVFTLFVASLFSAIALADGHQPVIVTFDAPGAGKIAETGTVPLTVAIGGEVTGFIRTDDYSRQGFVRDASGHITTFDAPNAGTGDAEGTRAYSITPGGAVSGWFNDANKVAYGFVRTPAGVVIEFDVPGAGSGAGQGTFGCYPCMTPLGTVAGYFVDGTGNYHSFLRYPGGGITTFDVPAASAAGGGTQAGAINLWGFVVGTYYDSNGNGHGFVRSPWGSITTFDVPNAVYGTYPGAINAFGAITGTYYDASGNGHFFVQTPAGVVTSFDFPPDAPAGSSPFSAVIAADGTIAACYLDASGNPHSFLRDAKGVMTNINIPRAVNGVQAIGISDDDLVTGGYLDSKSVSHGFIRMP